MNRGIGWFLMGLVSGVVGTLAWQRFRECYEQRQDFDQISDGISRRLEEMDSVLN